jgi:hypothetical protein
VTEKITGGCALIRQRYRLRFHPIFSTLVIVLSLLSDEGDAMAPHVFNKGLRVNTDEFINVLETEINRGWTRSLEIAETSYRRTAPTLTTERGHKNSSRRTCRR